jgi:hypothetical protein
MVKFNSPNHRQHPCRIFQQHCVAAAIIPR